MAKKRDALVVWGGWDGHEPEAVATVLGRLLRDEGFGVEVASSLDCFDDADRLARLSLIVPVWTMGTITDAQCKNVCDAVRGGVGLAGCHGGMCDSFRANTDWQFMTGGQWVAHPGDEGVEYAVRIVDSTHPITRDITDFSIRTEQYYMHVDPANRVLASTRFPIFDGPHVPNGKVNMPVIWTKWFGNGRVYYNAIGHRAANVASEPTQTLIRRGFVWAARESGI